MAGYCSVYLVLVSWLALIVVNMNSVDGILRQAPATKMTNAHHYGNMKSSGHNKGQMKQGHYHYGQRSENKASKKNYRGKLGNWKIPKFNVAKPDNFYATQFRYQHAQFWKGFWEHTKVHTSTEDDVITVTVCEFDQLRLNCAEGKGIQIKEAFFGTSEETEALCPNIYKNDGGNNCTDSFAEIVVTRMCKGRNDCVLPVSSKWFRGVWPKKECHDVYKALQVKYDCLGEIEVKTAPSKENVTCFDLHKKCKELSTSGGCGSRYRQLCWESCGVCGPNKGNICYDEWKWCSRVQKSKGCESDRMKTLCKHSCGLCETSENDEGDDEDEEDEDNTDDEDSCADQSSSCERLKRFCPKNNRMKKLCPKTCGDCTDEDEKVDEE